MAYFSDNIYPTRSIKYRGNTVHIVLQNENGPCPLLAIANVLILRGQISIDPSQGFVTSTQLRDLIAVSIRRQKVSAHGSLDARHKDQFLQNIQRSIDLLPTLEQGLDINIGYTKIDEYEFSESMIVFDTLDLKIYHGWLVDPTEPCYALFRSDGVRYNTIQDRLTALDSATAEERGSLGVISSWMTKHSSQLTSYGLGQLRKQIRNGTFGIFFRNNHFSCLLKHQDNIYLLVTDASFNDTPVCWEIPGVDDSTLYDENFHPLAQAETPSSTSTSNLPSIPSSSLSLPPSSTSTLAPPSPSSTTASSSSSISSPDPKAGKKTITFINTFTNVTKSIHPQNWPKSLDGLKKFLEVTFKDTLPPLYSITYKDPEDDWISMTTASEFEEGISLANTQEPPLLTIRISPPLGSMIASLSSFPPLPSSSIPQSPIKLNPSSTPTASPSPSSTSKPPSATPPSNTPTTPNTTIPIPTKPTTPTISIPSTSVPSPSPPPPYVEEKSDGFVPQWFHTRVESLVNRGYNEQISVDALIQNAGNLEQALQDLVDSQTPRNPNPASIPRPLKVAFPREFSDNVTNLYNIFGSFSPYLCSSALILAGGNSGKAAMNLTSDLTQYEQLLTITELTASIPDPQEVARREQARLEEARQFEAARHQQQLDEQRRQEEARRAEELRHQQEELRRQEEARRAEELRQQEEKRRQDEIRRQQQEELLRQEQQRLRADEDKRLQEETKRLEAARRSDESQKHVLKAKIASIDNEIASLEGQIKGLNSAKNEFNANIQFLHENADSLRQAVLKAEQALEDAKSEFNKAQESLAQAKNEFNSMDLQSTTLSDRLRHLEQERAKANEALQKFAPRASVILAADLPSTSSLSSFSLPPSFVANLIELEKLGFTNPEQNFSALIENAGNLERTVQALTQRK